MTIKTASSYRIKSIEFQISDIIGGEWTSRNNEEVFLPSPLPYFEIWIDNSTYVGHSNFKSITHIPNQGFSLIQHKGFKDMELPKYTCVYCAPTAYINQVNECNITDDTQSCGTNIIKFHDWREMHNTFKVRQGDVFTHNWDNPSQLSIPLTNVALSDSYTIHRCILNYGTSLNTQTQLGYNYTWDGCLDVTTAPQTGVEGKNHHEGFGEQRKRMRAENYEDLAYTEISDINYDHQQPIKKSDGAYNQQWQHGNSQ